jgi:peptidoglycan hydrolase CwlO-like protein
VSEADEAYSDWHKKQERVDEIKHDIDELQHKVEKL